MIAEAFTIVPLLSIFAKIDARHSSSRHYIKLRYRKPGETANRIASSGNTSRSHGAPGISAWNMVERGLRNVYRGAFQITCRRQQQRRDGGNFLSAQVATRAPISFLSRGYRSLIARRSVRAGKGRRTAAANAPRRKPVPSAPSRSIWPEHTVDVQTSLPAVPHPHPIRHPVVVPFYRTSDDSRTPGGRGSLTKNTGKKIGGRQRTVPSVYRQTGTGLIHGKKEVAALTKNCVW